MARIRVWSISFRKCEKLIAPSTLKAVLSARSVGGVKVIIMIS
jgi:hypothetical protein